MAKELAGKTIVITTTRSANVGELKDLVERAFAATPCKTCTSGGHLIMREVDSVNHDELSTITYG